MVKCQELHFDITVTLLARSRSKVGGKAKVRGQGHRSKVNWSRSKKMHLKNCGLTPTLPIQVSTSGSL